MQNARTMRLADDGNGRSLPRRFSFTVKALEGLRVPDGKDRVWVYDVQTPGLAFMLTAGGARSFYVYRKGESGKPIRHRLGGVELSIDRARRKALEVLAAGIETAASERKRLREESTLQDLFDAWYARVGGKKRSGRGDVENFTRYCSGIAGRRLSEVDTAMLARLHNDIGTSNFTGTSTGTKKRRKVKGGPYAANRVRALLSTVFNWGIRQAMLERNPTAAIERFPEHKRERILQPDELPRFLKAVEDLTDPALKDFFKLALWTGRRRSNVQAMRWADIDLVNRQWRIPAKSAKGKVQDVCTLAQQAVDILAERMKTADPEYVFPSHGKTGHLVEPKGAWDKLLAAAGLEDVRIHDLRRTAISYAAMNGASDRMLMSMFGISSQTVLSVYARLRSAPVQAEMQRAMDALAAAAKEGGEATPTK